VTIELAHFVVRPVPTCCRSMRTIGVWTHKFCALSHIVMPDDAVSGGFSICVHAKASGKTALQLAHNDAQTISGTG